MPHRWEPFCLPWCRFCLGSRTPNLNEAAQLELQKWQCAYYRKLMKLGKITYLSNGGFILEPDHPTVEHILPKSFFPELALNKQNLLIVCSDCNKRKSNNMAKTSRSCYEQLKLKLKHKRSRLNFCKCFPNV